MNVSPQVVLAVIGMGATLATTIFWASFYIGKIVSRLDRIDDTLKDQDARIDQLVRSMTR